MAQITKLLQGYRTENEMHPTGGLAPAAAQLTAVSATQSQCPEGEELEEFVIIRLCFQN